MPLNNKTKWLQTFHGRIDPTWKAVDQYAYSHCHPRSRPNQQALQTTLSTSEEAGLPDYGLSPSQGKLLALHCRSADVTQALEVGTLGGYSAIWMASENPKLKVTTMEYNQRHVDVARANIKMAGLQDRIEVIHGSGSEVLAKLREEIIAGRRERFGFVFIDADKQNNWNYFQLAKDMVKSNAVICIDNIAREGRLADESDRDLDVVASRKVVEEVGKLTGVDSIVLQTVGEKSYDGWLWAVVE